MNQFRAEIEPGPLGLHARPTCLLSEVFCRSESRACLRYDGREVDIRDMLRILSLAVCQGNTCELAWEGEDASQVLDRLRRLFDEDRNFEGFTFRLVS